MQKYIADIYQKDIYSIDYKALKEKGIKCLLFDFDNTLTPPNVTIPSNKLIKLFTKLKKEKFQIIIFSNSSKKKLQRFKKILGIETFSRALKPFRINFLRILNIFKYQRQEVAIIGDQLMTDIKGGNKAGIMTILVNPISTYELNVTKINRFFENKVIKKLEQNGLFKRGNYYE